LSFAADQFIDQMAPNEACPSGYHYLYGLFFHLFDPSMTLPIQIEKGVSSGSLMLA